MAVRDYAMIQDGTVVNVVVVDPDDIGGRSWLDTATRSHTLLDITDLERRPGPNWTVNGDGSFAPPEAATEEP